MSKRDQGALIEEYQRRGYLPEALVNFLCLLGWNPKDDREKLPLAEVIRLFDLPGINQSNARFDEKKLAHMNMAYLLELPADRFVTLARDYFRRKNVAPALAADEAYFREVMLLSQPKIKSIEELPAYTVYFFTEDFAVDPKARDKVMGKGNPKARLRELAEALKTADFSNEAALEQTVQALAAKQGLGVGDYIHPGRLAVSGVSVGPTFYGLLRILGRDRVFRRLERFFAAA
jgi:glutamyl-tRNA synthetase